MSSDTEPNIPSPKAALDQLKEWKELTAFIAVEAASVLGIFLSSGAAQIASSVLAAAVMTGGSWHVRRSYRRKKQREEQERLWEERRNQPRAAFRSLSPFEEQDELPGQDRKQLARSIAVRIVNDDFRFGIVCGDSGAGKTSLLRSEVMRNIRANGLEPVYLRSPRRLARTGLAVASSCERLAAELDAFTQEQIPADKCVLILDQFEEWFVEHREPEARALLGRFIARLIQRVPPVRVVCAVRREFLMDFHDLAAELPDPTNPANTFRVRNFTVAQAIDAVQQCALADGITAEEAFAAALAADLEENGEVQPTELQIVCTHLAESGSLSSDRYQAEGGTAGILAHHIKNALESCREPELGAKLLRSLCDFPTRTKRPPKTLAELAADIGRTAGSQTIAALVRTFVLARLLAEEKRKIGPDAYALLHDYLVGAVELATGDVSTQTEEANQLLRYHLAQQRGVIPLRRLRFI
ncbi:NACHT domain-containing protein, partial [Candidatus Electronema sp. JC]|uniref:nSTAND1 domain-containing NTPase n=1 Tax=Candidatus Electronema sp. JC TaxID=3401570 RepID=UPI003B434AE9